MLRNAILLLCVCATVPLLCGCLNGQDQDEGPPSGKAFPHLYIADSGNYRIVRVDDISGRGWVEVGLFGHGADHLAGPECVTVDSKIRILVGDSGEGEQAKNRIIRFDDMNGKNWVTFGAPGHGVNQFNHITDLATDAQDRIYAVDEKNYRIVRMDDMTGQGWITLGSDIRDGDKAGAFNQPEGIALDSKGRIYVADRSRIARFDDMTGKGWITYNPPDGPKSLSGACKVCLDATDRIFILDRNNGRVIRIDDMTGKNWTQVKTFGSGADKFGLTMPHGMCLDKQGAIYITDGIGIDNDTENVLNISRIVKADAPDYKVATTFGSLGKEPSMFEFPTSIAIR